MEDVSWRLNWKRRGSLLVMTLVFVSMFVVVFMALAGMVNRTYHESVLQAQDETAFQVAEAGLNYARWRLAHDPSNFEVETKEVSDPQAGVLGEYHVEFAEPQEGSTIVIITSEGTTSAQPSRTVTLQVRYGKASLAQYASITNEDVWYGSEIKGAVHSNGGIRMDGYSDGLMTSAKETYACQTYHGCSSPYETKPGIWGEGERSELWEFPVVAVDYNSLTMDLLAMKEAAVEADTYYGSSSKYGYQVVFNSNNTMTISKVTRKGQNVWSKAPGENYEYSSYDVGQTQVIETKEVESGSIYFFEDDVWVYGEIRSRVTIAAGVFPDRSSTNASIILNGNITYGDVHDGSRVFAAVAQKDILIPWSGAPDDMVLEGAFVAQNGAFYRRYYCPGSCGADAHRIKNSLTRYGMIASNGVPATAWVSGETLLSGFREGSAEYDPNLLYAPPPYFPTSGEYEFISWEEM